MINFMRNFYRVLLKRAFILTVFSILFTTNNLYATEEVILPEKNSLQDLSIVIASCDKYSGLWDPFFTLLFKNWPVINNGANRDLPIFLISNKKKFEHPRVQNISFPNEISWSDNMLETLSQVKTKYVLYLQEDYFLTKPVNEQLLEQMLNYIKEHNAAFLEVSGFNNNAQTTKQKVPLESSPNLAEFAKHSLYRTSLQAGIWSKDALVWLIKPGETAVEFELASSKRSEGMRDLFLVHLDVANDPIQYINAANGGLLLKTAIDYLHKQGIAFDPKLQPLPVDQDHKFILYKRKVVGYLKTVPYLQKIKEAIRNAINS